MLERVYSLFPALRERARQRAGTLSGGEGQILAIARALMSRPRFLMLDEPSLGIIDRKSTRLNSSHLVISYAVFCLKKKKKAYKSARTLNANLTAVTSKRAVRRNPNFVTHQNIEIIFG